MPEHGSKLINKFGSIAGWNQIVFNLGGHNVEGIKEFSYSDEVEHENIYGAGGYPIGQGSGNYSAKGSMTLLMEEVLGMQNSLPKGTRLQSVVASATVHYIYQDKVYKDRISNIRLIGNGREAKNGDKELTVKFDFACTHIDFNI